MWLPNTVEKSPFLQSFGWLFFKHQSTVIGVWNGKNNYMETSVKIKLLLCQTWWKLAQSWPGSLRVSSQAVLLSKWHRNQISPLADVSASALQRLWDMDDRWRWNQMWNLCSRVMARMNLEKFYHGLDEQLLTATKTSEDSTYEGRSTYVTCPHESFQLRLLAVTKGIFQQ